MESSSGSPPDTVAEGTGGEAVLVFLSPRPQEHPISPTRRTILRSLAGAATVTVAGPAFARSRTTPEPIPFSSKIAWKTWSDAAKQAKSAGTPRMLFVYADWCGVCRKVAPLFEREDVQKAASPLLLVRQNQDEAPAWLKPYMNLGGYVPRVLFLQPDGSVVTSITSGRSEYPYFYEDARTLVAAMKRAAVG